MKPIKFDLPLNGTRIATLEQLEENLTPEILEPFRSGKLAKWLRVRKLDEQAEAVEALLAGDNEREVQLLKSLYVLFDGENNEDLLRTEIMERKKELPSSQEKIDTEIEAIKSKYEIEIKQLESEKSNIKEYYKLEEANVRNTHEMVIEINKQKIILKNNAYIEIFSEIIDSTLSILNNVDTIDYKDINTMVQSIYDETNAVLKELFLIKMSIFNNQIRHLVEVIRKSKNATSKLSGFEESIVRVDYNYSDIFNICKVIVLLKTYRDKAKLLISVLRIMAEYFDVIKVNDDSNVDDFNNMLCIGKGLKELLNITIIDTNKNYATSENIKVNISGYLEI